MKMVYGLTLGEALPIVNGYKLESKLEAECFLAVHLKFHNSAIHHKQFDCAEDFIEDYENQIVQYNGMLPALPDKNSPAYKVVVEMIEGAKKMKTKFEKVLELLSAE